MMTNPFTKHPHKFKMTYLQHMGFALYLATGGLIVFISSLIHAFFPFLEEDTTSSTIKTMYYKIMKMQNKP